MQYKTQQQKPTMSLGATMEGMMEAALNLQGDATEMHPELSAKAFQKAHGMPGAVGHSKNVGLFSGVQAEITAIAPRTMINKKFYGEKLEPKETIYGDGAEKLPKSELKNKQKLEENETARKHCHRPRQPRKKSTIKNLLNVSSYLLMLSWCHGFSVSNRIFYRPQKLQLQGSSEEDSNAEEAAKEPDLFDYFDPLISPHAYTDGIRPDKKPQDLQSSPSEPNKTESNKPFGLGFFQSEVPGAVSDLSADITSNQPTQPDTSSMKSKFSRTKSDIVHDNEEEVDLFDVFDPTLSPHFYSNGIPSTKKSKKSIVGILLMDHGSKNQASNQRLHDIAQLYQTTMGDPTSVIVKAAHMEIAKPTIPEVLLQLIEEGADEIVCHPYFLSPGRHVKEDIPRIIEQAIEELDISIPIVTTSPVGSNTDLMISAIHAMVEQSSSTIRQNRKLGF